MKKLFLFLILAGVLLANSQTVPITVTLPGTVTLPPVKGLITITNGVLDCARGCRFYQFISAPTEIRIANVTNIEDTVITLYADNPAQFPITWPVPYKLKGLPYSQTNDYPIALFEFVKSRLILTIQ